MSILEISVLSVEGLHRYTCSPFTALFCNPIASFITLTKIPHTDGDKPSHVCSSKVPTWDHKFRVPVDSTFFSDRYSSLQLQLHVKRRIVGQAQLGWCLIPASDIGFLPSGSLRYLSYRLRDKDGSRGHGIINLCVRLEGMVPSADARQTVIGVPVTAIRESKGMKGMMMRDDSEGGARERREMEIRKLR